jgi:hypothetical protein
MGLVAQGLVPGNFCNQLLTHGQDIWMIVKLMSGQFICCLVTTKRPSFDRVSCSVLCLMAVHFNDMLHHFQQLLQKVVIWFVDIDLNGNIGQKGSESSHYKLVIHPNAKRLLLTARKKKGLYCCI